jgi:hypothetical protein
MKRIHRIVAACVAGVLAFAVAPSAFAQGVLDEITVTAQKREQNIQDVGIAINAFSGDQMRDLGIERSFDIAAFSPGVHIVTWQVRIPSFRSVALRRMILTTSSRRRMPYIWMKVILRLPRHRPLPRLISNVWRS